MPELVCRHYDAGEAAGILHYGHTVHLETNSALYVIYFATLFKIRIQRQLVTVERTVCTYQLTRDTGALLTGL